MNGAARSQTLILRSLPQGVAKRRPSQATGYGKRLEGWADDASFETRSCGALLRMRGSGHVAPVLKMWSMR